MNAFPSPPLPRDANSDLSPIDDEALGTLPRWKLSDLYTSTDDPAINRDLEWAESQARELAAAAKGQMAGMSAEKLAERKAEIESIAGTTTVRPSRGSPSGALSPSPLP